MLKSKAKANAVDILFFIVFVTVFAVFLRYIAKVKEAVIEAGKACLYGIIPSLFAVCVLCSWAAEYGVFEKVFYKSKINPAILCAFILGNIGGYPIGAKILKDYVVKGRITREQAEKAICFAFSPGPAFCLGVVSPLVFHNTALGWIIYLSVFFSNAVIFLIFRKSFAESDGAVRKTTESFSDCLTNSVNSATYSMIAICSAILFFSAVSAVLRELLPCLSDKKIVYALMEISQVTGLKYSGLISFIIISAVISFGGLCVLLQVKSLIGKSFEIGLFLKTRVLQIGLASMFCGVTYSIAYRYIPAATNEYTYVFTQAHSILPFICTAGMTAISITYRKKQRKM